MASQGARGPRPPRRRPRGRVFALGGAHRPRAPPRLAAFLGWDGWRPIAALSYSVYLLQYIGGLLAWTPFFTHVVAPRMALERELPAEEWTGARMALAAAIVHGKLLFVLLGTLPLALANYVLVERPLMLHGRRVASMIPERCGAVYVDKAEALV